MYNRIQIYVTIILIWIISITIMKSLGVFSASGAILWRLSAMAGRTNVLFGISIWATVLRAQKLPQAKELREEVHTTGAFPCRAWLSIARRSACYRSLSVQRENFRLREKVQWREAPRGSTYRNCEKTCIPKGLSLRLAAHRAGRPAQNRGESRSDRGIAR